jgi:hypothetical protein
MELSMRRGSAAEPTAIADLIPLRRRQPDPTLAAPQPPHPGQQDLDDLALQTEWLRAVFASLEMLDDGLGRLEAAHATLPANPGSDRLSEERSRLSCELFQLRMAAVQLSGQLAESRRAARR